MVRVGCPGRILLRRSPLLQPSADGLRARRCGIRAPKAHNDHFSDQLIERKLLCTVLNGRRLSAGRRHCVETALILVMENEYHGSESTIKRTPVGKQLQEW